MHRFIDGEDRMQQALLPHSLEDYVDEENPVRVIEVFIEELDLAALGFSGVTPAATGRPGYHPSTLLKIYLYGGGGGIGRRAARRASPHLNRRDGTARGRIDPLCWDVANTMPFNPVLLKALAALIPVGLLCAGAAIMYVRERSLPSTLLLLGAACLVMVVLAHICEALHELPWMRWGDQTVPVIIWIWRALLWASLCFCSGISFA